VLTHSVLQLPEKALLTSKTEHGGKNEVPSLPSSQQAAASSDAVFFEQGPKERF